MSGIQSNIPNFSFQDPQTAAMLKKYEAMPAEELRKLQQQKRWDDTLAYFKQPMKHTQPRNMTPAEEPWGYDGGDDEGGGLDYEA